MQLLIVSKKFIEGSIVFFLGRCAKAGIGFFVAVTCIFQENSKERFDV
tara:strand:+ start:18 stop:161 length:144 start_codon:yes stop_codon:yes gene_type:complete